MHSGDVYVYLVSVSHLVLLSSVAHGAHLCHCAMGIGAVQFWVGAWRPRGAPLHYPGATSTWMITGRQAVQEPGLSR